MNNCPHCTALRAEICACGNYARYINERDELCCALCPIRERIESIKISDALRLWDWCTTHVTHNMQAAAMVHDEWHAINELLALQNDCGAFINVGARIAWCRAWLIRNPEASPHDKDCACKHCTLRALIGRSPK